MGAWSKPKKITDVPTAYGVYPVGTKYGVGLFRIDTPKPELITTVRLRADTEPLQVVADRLNSRLGVTRERAIEIVAECSR